MTLADQNGREVEVSITGSHDDDIQLVDACYSDGEELPEHVIEWLEQNYAAEIFEEWLQVKVSEVEWMAEAWKDGTL